VQRQITAFASQVDRPSDDLSREQTVSNWRQLLNAAEQYGLKLDDTIRRLAARSTEDPGGDDEPDLASLPDNELRERLKQPEPDPEAAVELLRRGDADELDEVFRALAKMQPEEVFRVTPHLLRLGESAVDALTAGLTSKSEALRHGSALVAGRLKLRRAIAPLIKQLREEKTEAWTELARGLGEFGSSAFKRVISAFRGENGPEDRLVLVLAHLANHGCAGQLESLQKDPNPWIASAARRANAQRSKVEWEDSAVRTQKKLGKASAAALRSQLFYAELSKVAIG
jgi:hypothetical protein